MKVSGVLIFVIIATVSAEQIIFKDDFNGNAVNESKWKFEHTLSGGGDWQFQWYVPDAENAFVKNGILHLKPTLTADFIGEQKLYKKKVKIDRKDCTSSRNWGCERQGTPANIINPVRSASIQTKEAFRFGTIEIKAKLPAGDWLRPSIKLIPRDNRYGPWPASGQIVMLESRGNRELYDDDDNSVGIDKVASTLHFGPSFDANAWEKAHYVKQANCGFNEDFHIFKVDWTETGIKFVVDGEEVGSFETKTDGNFWSFGEFEDNYADKTNPWIGGTSMAPFDKHFNIVISLAVGGVSNYFSDSFVNRGAVKPWLDTSPQAPLDFWKKKDDWYNTWTSTDDGADFQIDYVKVFTK